MQKIFKDNYEVIEYALHPRDVVMENISKMISCGDPSFGGAMYGCPHCGELKFVPFRCNSKFCPTCGNKYCIDRSTRMSFKLIHYTHRHLVFTIDDSLRHFFLEYHSLLGCLFLVSFGYDPLKCPRCGHTMRFLDLYHNHNRVSLVELYERDMAGYPCRPSGKST